MSLITSFIMAQCDPVTVVFSAGDGVSAISKTVTYQTVTGVKGEPDKCWITSNLGASNEATSVGDPSESAAGWYWQFNTLQGYAHDGTIRTPNNAWIVLPNGTSDWTNENDPCRILGEGWRIPTFLEWAHVDYSWWNWNYAYNSPLKLNAAGYIYSNGQLKNRGVQGWYWSSTGAVYSSYGRTLWFWSATSNTTMTAKTIGESVRCLK